MHDNWKTVLQLTLSAEGLNKEKFWLDSELAPSSGATFHSLRKILGKINKFKKPTTHSYIYVKQNKYLGAIRLPKN